MQFNWLSVFALALVLISPLNSFFSTTKAAPDAAGWQLTGHAGGPTQGLAVQGNYAYIGVGPRLVVVDISDPANPHQVGESEVMADFVLGVAVNGTYAFVAAGGAGIRVVDISSPTHPVEVGAWNSPGYAEGVAVAGSTAYLADGPDGMWVVDVSNPATPFKIGSVFDMNYAYDVVVSGRYAYVAAGGAGLLVVDVSTPSLPVELGVYDTPGNARGVAASAGQVLVADERYGLQIVNVVDPLHPALLGSLQIQGWVFDVTVAGSLVYVASAFGGLHVVNVSNPAHPIEIGGLSWAQSHAAGIAVAASQVYIADRKNGLRVINVLNPANPVQVGYWNQFAFAQSVEVGGNYAYVAAGFNGVRVFDISNPTHPVEVSKYLVDGFFYTLKLSGTRLYAGTMHNSPEGGLYVFDLSDPTHLQMIGYYADIGECWGIDVAGSIAYVADTNSLKVFDFSNPPNLNLLGFYPLVPRGLTVRDGLAFVSQEFDGVRIYNVANPAAISLVGSFSSSNSFTHGPVVLAGNYAYVAESWGLRVLNVVNPANPTEVSFTPTRNGTNWLALSGSQLYISESSYGFSVYDVSDPSAPLLTSQTGILGSAQGLALGGGHLFAASSEGGLQIFTETDGSAALTPELTQAPALPPSAPRRRLELIRPVQDIPAIPPAPNRSADTCTVTSAADSGPGTLRECLWNQVSGDLITFSPAVFPTANPTTIYLSGQLPAVSQGNITIDASNAGVILDGSSIGGSWTNGLGITSNNNIVRGLQIQHFSGSGLAIAGGSNIIGGSRLVGSGPTGQGNVLSGNHYSGISIQSFLPEYPAYGNLVIGNIVGLDASGTQPFGNENIGIGIWGSQNNIIGSQEAGENNVVSANGLDGIQLYGFTNNGNQILGNLVGTDITGNVNLGNENFGVLIQSGSANTLLQGNLISGNLFSEVCIWDFTTDYVVLAGNRIGTNLDGTQPLPNLGSGGILIGLAAYVRIGGGFPGEGNIVASHYGVSVDSPFAGDTLVQGNHIGLNSAGTAWLPNAGGLTLSGATRAIVGGANTADGNLFGNKGHWAIGVESANNVIQGNHLGLAADGVTPLGDSGFQISILRDGNVIQGNRIASATSAGIWVDGSQRNTIRRNAIFDNAWRGIYTSSGANGGIAAPAVVLNAAGGGGTTCPGCTVELFLDAGYQGRHYLATVVADAAGAFAFSKSCPVFYPNLTATVTDPLGNTSEFSSPHSVAWDCSSANPAPQLISVYPNEVMESDPTMLIHLVGNGFIPGSVVQFNGFDLTTLYVDGSNLGAILPVGQIKITGDTSITVFNPGPGGGTSNPLTFMILALPRIYLPAVIK